MSQKLIILRGLPASGKTTWAKSYIKEFPKTVRISRDDIRTMLTPNFRHGSIMENLVTSIEDVSIAEALDDEYSVIVDATNFRGIKRFENIVQGLQMGTELEIKEFDTDLKTCIQRDQQRENSVGKEIIERMYNKYLKNVDS